MLFDPDHMSVEGPQLRARPDRGDATTTACVSSHSWSTPDAYPRIYQLGGFITPYAGDSTGFVEKWRTHVGWADPRYYFGIGYGADMNGLGAQGDPRGADVAEPGHLPLHGPERRHGRASSTPASASTTSTPTASRSTASTPTGSRTCARSPTPSTPGRGAIAEDMARGAEAYLQMWERAEGIAPTRAATPGCASRSPGAGPRRARA